jgi:transcriptional regulator with XRE-family HTH domain
MEKAETTNPKVQGKGVRLARVAGDVSQATLAARVGLSASRLSQIEHGKIVATPAELRRIWEALST